METKNILHDLDPKTAQQWLEEGKARLLDVREDHEFEIMRIPGSLLLPKSRFFSDRLPASDDTPFIFSCKAGVRSRHCAERFMEETGQKESYHMVGGIDAWAAQGFPIETKLTLRYKIQKLVSSFLALLIFSTIPLGALVHWAFFTPLLIVGAFFTHAAITGTSLIEWYFERFVGQRPTTFSRGE